MTVFNTERITPSSVRRGQGVVLGMGNDILCDDAVGLLAARALREAFGDRVDVIETAEAGLALIELLEGYKQVLIIDAIKTEAVRVGTIIEYTPDDFQKIVAPSPHYAGLPEVLEMAKRLELEFPTDIRILAMEVENPFEIREGLTEQVEVALPELIARAEAVVKDFLTTPPGGGRAGGGESV
jgi:hydrogenase maturation protease